MATTYIMVLFLSFIAGITAIFGVVIAFYFQKNGKGISAGIGFAIGMMLLISLFELIPESVDSVGAAGALVAVILGILLVIILDLFIPESCLTHSNGSFDKNLLRAAYCVAFVLILHNFPEGLAITSSYLHSPHMGILLAFAVAVHNIPEGFAFAVPLLASGKSKKFVFKTGLLSSLSEPAGALLGILLLSFLPVLNPFFMAFAAGAMIFVSIHDLWPMAIKYKNNKMFVLGLILSVIIYFCLAIFFPD